MKGPTFSRRSCPHIAAEPDWVQAGVLLSVSDMAAPQTHPEHSQSSLPSCTLYLPVNITGGASAWSALFMKPAGVKPAGII